MARASYYGLCSFIDVLAGQVLRALEDCGQDKETLVLYTSDHGELLGNHGLWTKCVMYEDSAAIPMLLAGPGVPGRSTLSEWLGVRASVCSLGRRHRLRS